MKKFILKSSAIIFAIIFGITYLSNAAQPTWTKIDTKNGAPADVAYDSLGNAYFVSSAQQSPTSSMDIRIIKYSKTGVLLGTVYYDYKGLTDVPVKVIIEGASIYVIGTGKSNLGPALHDDALLVKYNLSLVFQWATNENSNFNGEDAAVDIAIDKYGTIYVLCSFESSAVGVTDYDIGMFAINSDGTNKHANYWNNNTTGTNQIAKRIILNINRVTVYICGANQTAANGYDGLLLRINGSLGVDLRKDFHFANDTLYECFKDMAVDTNANLLMWGEYHTATNLVRPFVVKYDFQGNYIWNSLFTGINTSEYPVKIFVDNSQSPIGITSAGRFLKYNTANGFITNNKPTVGKIIEIRNASINSKGQVYTCGVEAYLNGNGGFNTAAYMAKRSNSGTFGWESNWITGSAAVEGNSYVALAVFSNRIYAIGANNYAGGFKHLMHCFKPTGALRVAEDEDAQEMNSLDSENQKIEAAAEFSFKVYPNPTSNYVNVNYDGMNPSEFTIRLFDETGKIIREINPDNNETKVDLSNMSEGKYFITAVGKEGKQLETFKIIKLK